MVHDKDSRDRRDSISPVVKRETVMARRRERTGEDRVGSGLIKRLVVTGLLALCAVVVARANDALLIPPAPTEPYSDLIAAADDDVANTPPAPPMPALIPPPPAPMVDAAIDTDLSDSTAVAETMVAPARAFRDDVVTVHFEEHDWDVTIIPGTPTDDATSREYRAAYREYRAAYDAVPYRRAEYLANPSYRHDAAMEILFGEMRPTVIHRQQKPERIVNPRPSLTQPYRASTSELWSYPLPPYFGYPSPLSGWNPYPPTYLQY